MQIAYLRALGIPSYISKDAPYEEDVSAQHPLQSKRSPQHLAPVAAPIVPNTARIASVKASAPPQVIPSTPPLLHTLQVQAVALDEHAVRHDNWDELQQAVRTCQACALHQTRTQSVFGAGALPADWMIIGEAPGMEEDKAGLPFVGRAGQLLTRMLASLSLNREQVFITNILKSRPPNNRDPLPAEIAACWPYLQRQIQLINPRIILVVGRIAAQTLLKTSKPIGHLRGQVHYLTHHDRSIPLIVTYHPAYLLRQPIEKAKSWQDLKLAMRTFQHATAQS